MSTSKKLNFSHPTSDSPGFKNINLNWNIDAHSNLVLSDLKGFTYSDTTSNPSEFTVNLKLENWVKNNAVNFEQLLQRSQADLFTFPVSFLNTWTSRSDFPIFLGETVDIEFKTLIDLYNNTRGYCDVFIDSTKFHGKARLKIDQAVTLYESSKPTAEFAYTLTPEVYEYIKKLSEPEISMSSPTRSR